MAVEFPRGRLWVGWRGMDWTKVYCEPLCAVVQVVTKADKVDTKAPDLLYYQTPTARPDNGNPVEGEINWLPHFDPGNFDGKRAAQKHCQGWFVYQAWEHLKAKDGEIEKVRRANHLAKGRNMRWESWVVHADRWRRKHPRGPYDEDPDDGYESDPNAMGPPRQPRGPRGGGGGGDGGGPSGGAGGKRKATNHRPKPSSKKKPKTTPSSSSSSSGSRQKPGERYMSGGLYGSANPIEINSDDDEDEEQENGDNERDDFSDRHPTPLEIPHTAQRIKGLAFRKTPRHTGQEQRRSMTASSNNLFVGGNDRFDDGGLANINGGVQSGDSDNDGEDDGDHDGEEDEDGELPHRTTRSMSVVRPKAQAETNVQHADERDYDSDGFSRRELNEAMRASEAPDEARSQRVGGVDQGARASLAPEIGDGGEEEMQGYVQPSIEEVDEGLGE
ncbi:hypothetical protein LTR08_000080 [Meristemomyces frigidus]|nr:hypothetical protein LTR08_000080 [Meristemomyces frigidus]